MLSRRPFAAVMALALVAPVTALIASPTASAAPTPSAKRIVAKHLPRPTRDAGPARAHDPHSVLVKFKKTATSATRDKAVRSRGARVSAAVAGTGFVKVTTSGRADELASRLSRDPSVDTVSLDYIRRAAWTTPNDLGYADQSYLQTVRMPDAWDRSKGSLTQVVAVVDSGVNGQHPDLAGRTVPGFNALTDLAIASGAVSDDNGHGSMVAGIIAAQTNNTEGIAGVAWNAKVMPVKVLDAQGDGSDSDVIQGLVWAADHGAKTINLSLGGPDDDPALHDAVKYAVGKGAVVVVAAGNSGDDLPEYPAAYPEVIAVGATDASGRLTDFSTHGTWVDVAAPGWGILSTGLGTDYYYGDGTSFAAPIVSGIAVLIHTQSPSLTPAQIAARLRSTARDAGPRGIDPFYGAGIVDAANALGAGQDWDFDQPAIGANEPNDVPARATPLTGATTGTIGTEGDVDWYRYVSPRAHHVSVSVTPPAYDWNNPQNVDAAIAVYDENLRLVGEADTGAEGVAETVGLRMTDAPYYVAVRNFNGSRVPDQTYQLSVTEDGSGDFDSGVVTAVPGAQSGPIAVGDLNGDGHDDLAVAQTTVPGASQVQLLLGDGTGGLGTPVGLATSGGSLARNLVVTDLDGDGRLDLVCSTSTGVQVFQQTQEHTLSPAQVVPGTSDAAYVSVTDLDGDTRPDLVVSGPAGTTALLAQPDGTWASTQVDDSATDESEVGDLDGDGRADIAVKSASSVRVLHNTAAGWTADDHAVAPTSGIRGIEVADVNGDSRPDLLAVTGGSQPDATLQVWSQRADGTLSSPSTIAVPDAPGPLEAGDVNGDGRADVLMAHDGGGRVSALTQRTDGTLSSPNSSPVEVSPHYDLGALAARDLTGDGRADLVLASSSGVVVLPNAGGPTPGGAQEWVRSVSPADFATKSAVATVPTVTFGRDVDPASVTASTVGILNGRSGARLPASVTYDVSTRTATVRPTTPLYDFAAYRLTVSGVTDASGGTMDTAYTSTFQTVDTAPPVPGSFKATGAWGSATLSWTPPAAYDMGTYIVQMTTGSTPPASVTAGTTVYWGSGTKVTVPKLVNGTTYSFRIWARDRSMKYSSPATAKLVGTGVTMTSNVTALTYGGSVTVSTRLTRRDTGGAIAGVPVQLYARKVGTSTWTLTATRTSSSTGTVSFVHKPTTSVDYLWVYRGSGTYLGSSSTARRVGVRMAITSTVSRTSVPLGGTFSLYGSVSPSHAGQTIYLQRYVGSGRWTTVATRRLTSTSGFSFAVKPTFRGTLTYRAFLWDDTDHLTSYGPSRAVKVT